MTPSTLYNVHGTPSTLYNVHMTPSTLYNVHVTPSTLYNVHVKPNTLYNVHVTLSFVTCSVRGRSGKAKSKSTNVRGGEDLTEDQLDRNRNILESK